ncbi:MAG: biosynthetic peptidoglycan transglycosylase [Bacteroidales bacterium]
MSTKTINKNNKTLIAIAVGVLVFCAILLLLLLVPSIIERKIKEITPSMSSKIENFDFKKLTINSLSSAQIEEINITTNNNIRLLYARRVAIELSPWKALLGKAEIESLDIDSMEIFLLKNDSINNIPSMLSSKEVTQYDIDSTRKDWAKRVYKLSTLALSRIPKTVNIRNLNIKYSIYSDKGEIYIDSAEIEQKESNKRVYKANITTCTDTTRQQANIEGEIISSNTPSFYAHIYKADSTSLIQIPKISRANNIEGEFSEMELRVNFTTLSSDSSTVTCSLKAKNPSIDYWRISSKKVTTPELASELLISILPSEIRLEPNSSITINRLKIHPTMKIGYKKDWYMRISIDEPLFDANDMMNAIPEGLFQSFSTVKLSGNLSYHLLAELDLSMPDSLLFDSKLTRAPNFIIEDIGILDKMNNTFIYNAYDNDVVLRSFSIDKSNPQFRKASEISPLLRNAILQSEDGQFFLHRGFRMDALREALIYDIKQRRFARGGSTISMQLIKNVFLNREKSITRKIEEALIVWLIEENKVTSKERMFDTYINIIEWGPNVYGVTEATKFYFDKNPNETTLDEAIFLASIIPRPTKYRWSFTSDGQLAEHQYPHFRIVKERLIQNGIIDSSIDANEKPFILLRGKAKEVFTK